MNILESFPWKCLFKKFLAKVRAIEELSCITLPSCPVTLSWPTLEEGGAGSVDESAAELLAFVDSM